MAFAALALTSTGHRAPASAGSDDEAAVAAPSPAVPADLAPADPASRSSFTAELTAGNDHVGDLPPEVRDVGVDEKIGQRLPLDLVLHSSEGKEVRLGDYFDGSLPVIVTFNYSSCPMLCSLQLNALFEAVKQLQFSVGRQYRIVTISLDPRETPASASTLKGKYIDGLAADRRELASSGWAFLTGDEEAIAAATSAAGVRYRYIEKSREYAHPASLIFTSPRGTITRYYHGIFYEPAELSRAIFSAGAGEEGGSIGFLLACFQLCEPSGYGKMASNIMYYGTVGFLFLILVIVAVIFRGRLLGLVRRTQPDAGRSSNE